jgi:replicative DNA helicase
MSTDPRLPRADAAERYLIRCCVAWPERAHEILPLCKPTDFLDTLHQKIWREFATQYATTGGIDPMAVAKRLDCAAYLLELGQDAATAVHAATHAESLRDAARARRLFDVAQNAAQALLRGRPVDSVLTSLHMALDQFEKEAAA